MIIAIDGPAGSGKSTIAKLVAKNLNIDYLDTGAMYRMVTYYMLKNQIDINNQKEVTSQMNNIKINIKDGIFYLNDVNVSSEIRDPKVTTNVSKISSYKMVREHLVHEQQTIGSKNSCILDGRDIGSVVFPNAKYKFFLTASVEERAQRRFLENQKTNFSQTKEQILAEIIKRDNLDSTRKESPLIKTSDAIEIDTSNLTIEQVVAIIIKKIK